MRRGAFNEVLKGAIAERESSFTLPAYEQRWNTFNGYSQELMNEYWHHLVSLAETADGWHDLFHHQVISKKITNWFEETNPSNTAQKLDRMLETTLRNEGRL
jgi:hypothetical protein